MRILFLTYESWPTHRADVTVLFGKYLRRHGIGTDIVADAAECGEEVGPVWDGGAVFGCRRPRSRPAQHLAKLWLNVQRIVRADKAHHACIQVRDMSLSALVALAAARVKGIPFVYWLSYLQSEGHIGRARARGPRAGMKYWYPLVEGLAGRFILYRIVLPRADHVFVQSEAMKARLAAAGVPASRMTPVPMGVDTEDSDAWLAPPAQAAALAGRRTLVYLGLQDRERKPELLLHMLAQVRLRVPNVVLVMAGDTADEDQRAWLRKEAVRLGVADHLVWTGWLSRRQAWAWVRAAELGLSPIPRGEIFDASSPTKAVEYMALSVPVVGNDSPDQKLVIEASGAGICVPLDAASFAEAVVSLLNDEQARRHMAARGPAWVRATRSYAHLATTVAGVYRQVCGGQPEHSADPVGEGDACTIAADTAREDAGVQ